jgi:hypothetical protein
MCVCACMVCDMCVCCGVCVCMHCGSGYGVVCVWCVVYVYVCVVYGLCVCGICVCMYMCVHLCVCVVCVGCVNIHLCTSGALSSSWYPPAGFGRKPWCPHCVCSSFSELDNPIQVTTRESQGLWNRLFCRGLARGQSAHRRLEFFFFGSFH